MASYGDDDDSGRRQPPQHRPSAGGGGGGGDLASSAKLVAEAAKSVFQDHNLEKVDKGRVAGASSSILHAASQYGKLEGKPMGNYLEKAEEYLHQYGRKEGPGGGGKHQEEGEEEGKYKKKPGGHGGSGAIHGGGRYEEEGEYKKKPSDGRYEEEGEYRKKPSGGGGYGGGRHEEEEDHRKKPASGGYGGGRYEDEDEHKKKPTSGGGYGGGRYEEEDEYKKKPTSGGYGGGRYEQEDDYKRPPTGGAGYGGGRYEEEDEYRKKPSGGSYSGGRYEEEDDYRKKPSAGGYGGGGGRYEDEYKKKPSGGHGGGRYEEDDEYKKPSGGYGYGTSSGGRYEEDYKKKPGGHSGGRYEEEEGYKKTSGHGGGRYGKEEEEEDNRKKHGSHHESGNDKSEGGGIGDYLNLYVDKPPSYGVSSRENPTQVAACSAQQGKEENAEKIDFHERVPGNLSNRIVKGNESLAIIAFGIQILQHPQFSKLCWVTSKLREGPCTDINGPWKGWPFNSCLLHSSTSPDKSLSGGNSVLKGKEKILCVRGLVAVGLLAYRGLYASVMEVCTEVRKVLELLVGQIQTKILEKKSRYRYFHILSHVAYLDDIVNSWAYTFQRLHIDNRTGASGTKITSLGRSCTRECQSTSYAAESNVQVAPAGCSEIQEIPPEHTHDHQVDPACCPSEMQDNPVQHAPDQLEIHKMVCDLDNDHVASISSMDAVEHDLVHSASPDVHKGSLTPTDTVINDGESVGVNNDGMSRVTNGEENCRPDIQRSESHTESVEDFNDFRRAEISVASSASIDNAGISRNMVSSEAHGVRNELNTNFPQNDIESGHLINGQPQGCIKNHSVPKSSCLYKCCSACFHAVYKMAHDILSNSVRPKLHCLTIDDMHDILSSWSLNLLATVRKWYSSQDVVGCEENFGRRPYREVLSEHCFCQSDVSFLSRECTCHMESNEDAGTIKNESHSLLWQPLSFFFKDGVLMPPDLTAETTLHCSFRRLCVCSILGAFSMCNQISS